MSHRPAIAALAALLLVAPAAPLVAQSTETGVQLVLADWLEPWEETGGWMAVPAGAGIGKGGSLITEPAASLTPGLYDIYWVQSEAVDPFAIATEIAVLDGDMTEVRIATGVTLEVADWVEPRDPETGTFGVLLPETTDFDFFSQTATGNALVLPPGDYLAYYHPGGDDDRPPTFIGGGSVEAPFGGLGIEITIENDRLVIVQALAGGAAAEAGIEAGDVVVDVDGAPLAGLELAEAGAALRGPPETIAVLTVLRGKETLNFEIERVTVEPSRTVVAASGIQLVTEVGVFTEDGWWGVVYAGNTVEGFDDLIKWVIGTNGGPMLLGPTAYDVYWSPDGIGPPILIEANVQLDDELVEVVAESPR